MTRPRQVEEEHVGRAALLAKVGTESIWTVDLLFLLQVRGGFPGSVDIRELGLVIQKKLS